MDFNLIMLILVLVVGFYMAWNIGANDVSNAMGTSVGSGALTLKKAIFLAAILEFCGAFFLGSNVSHTMQHGLIDTSVFDNTPSLFVIGMFSALLATSLWLQVASYFGWPVSATHAIVGSILGFGGVIGGAKAVHWPEVGSIAISWIISPLLSALLSFSLFSFLQRKILFSINPTHQSKKLVPILIGIVFATFTISLTLGGLHNLKLAITPIESISIAVVVGCISYLISLIFIRKIKIPDEMNIINKQGYTQQLISLNKTFKHLKRAELLAEHETKQELTYILSKIEDLSQKLSEKSGRHLIHSEYQTVERMFAILQILSACYVAFAHGANDVANAIGPIGAVLDTLQSASYSAASSDVPTWLLAFGGAGIVVGLATWGWRVIQTIGKKITELTPTRGFSAEFGAAITILFASKLGIPVSTTHCIVGAVLGVGLAKGISAINLRTLRDIGLSWLVTIPSAALLSILLYFIFSSLFRI
jgi:PiT family inorganic phosphate transporter